MITLCMDTSQSFLVLALLDENNVIGCVQKECWKRQSEELFPCLIQLMEDHSLTPEDIGAIVITKGPGSYTGVRIAMSVAKVFASLKEIPLYTLSSLQLYAGTLDHCHVLMDARGHRAYHAVYHRGILQGREEAIDTDVLKEQIGTHDMVVGDGHLIGRDDVWNDLGTNFLALKDQWKRAENVHLLTPEYLKSSESYLVKKP